MVASGIHNDNDLKRKRATFSTFEKAKATHLSRQLHLRLQYARLKVEHGWQRQTLNEVENLYFRHSRKPRLEPIPAPERIEPVTPTNRSSSGSRRTPDVPKSVPLVETQPAQEDSEDLPIPDETTPSKQQSPFKPIPLPSQTPSSRPPTPSASPLQQTTIDSSSPSQPHQIPRRTSSIKSSNSSLNLANSNLTYDSFWSSHSSSTLQYRTLLANSPSATSSTISNQNPTPSTTFLGTSPSATTTTLAPSFLPQPIQYSQMGAFDHSDLAFARYENPPAPSYIPTSQNNASIAAQSTYYRR